jgi:hypothetical protein
MLTRHRSPLCAYSQPNQKVNLKQEIAARLKECRAWSIKSAADIAKLTFSSGEECPTELEVTYDAVFTLFAARPPKKRKFRICPAPDLGIWFPMLFFGNK